MLEDGDLKITLSSQKIANMNNLTYQVTPWLEATFRYTIFNPDNPIRNTFTLDGLNDRSYSAKIKILDERKYRPQVVFGMQDIIGTGTLNAEYLVASKKIGHFDLSLGLGWGILGADGNVRNPFISIDNRFESRLNSSSGEGGDFNNQFWFSGKRKNFYVSSV